MFTTFLRIVRPYLQRFLTKRAAEYAADYLQARREQRLMDQAEQQVTETALSNELATTSTVESSPTSASFLASDPFWFTLSGILLGTALSVIVALLLKQHD
jgi:hypothetical protein